MKQPENTMKETKKVAKETEGGWQISEDVKKRYIDAVIPELKLLRAKAGISQDDLAGLLDISRQTYCQFENGSREMPWSIYLSLMFIFNSIEETAKLISLLDLFPVVFVEQIKSGSQSKQTRSM